MSGLVTILTRTLGRPCLADAAACVAAQTYRPIEWLIVDAAGGGLEAPSAGDVEVRVVSSGRPLLRSPAANFGLDHARGPRALILDDDDLLLPHCIERLSAALDAHPGVRVAYGDVQVDAGDAQSTGCYKFEYSELLITRRNLFPPIGGLFDMSLWRDDGVRFDDMLNWYDDWYFWLQVSKRTAFHHVRQITSIYRQFLSQSGVNDPDAPDADPRIREQRAIVLASCAGRRAALEARHDALKREAAALTAAGRLHDAAVAWAAAHANYHYDTEPILGYADVALKAGDPAAARKVIEGGLVLMPSDASLHRARADLLERAGDRQRAANARAHARKLDAVGPVSPI